jgi:hypothetical protein
VVNIIEFCDEINFEKLKKSPRKHKEDVDFEGYFHSSDILNRTNIPKIGTATKRSITQRLRHKT